MIIIIIHVRTMPKIVSLPFLTFMAHKCVFHWICMLNSILEFVCYLKCLRKQYTVTDRMNHSQYLITMSICLYLCCNILFTHTFLKRIRRNARSLLWFFVYMIAKFVWKNNSIAGDDAEMTIFIDIDVLSCRCRMQYNTKYRVSTKKTVNMWHFCLFRMRSTKDISMTQMKQIITE